MKRKGITPVIAIVLLLLVTVAAVGVVYTQFQSLSGNPDEEAASQQQLQNTQLEIQSVYNNDTGNSATNGDTMNITVQNTGTVSFNLTRDMSISYAPDGGEGGLTFDTLASDDTTQSESWCFKPQGDNSGLEPGDTYTCKTGVKWPEATESTGIEIQFRTKSWSYTCTPTTSNSLTC